MRLLRRFWRWLTQAAAREEFESHREEIRRRNRELRESIARGCRRTDGSM